MSPSAPVAALCLLVVLHGVACARRVPHPDAAASRTVSDAAVPSRPRPFAGSASPDAGEGPLTAREMQRVRRMSPVLSNLYRANPPNPPLPSSKTIFSCPSAPDPSKAANPYKNPPHFSRALFMYGENGRLCINKGGATRVVPNTKLINVKKPSDTVFIAEVDPNSPDNSNVSQSNVTGQYAVGRHDQRGNFSFCAGSARGIRTNDFVRKSAESNNASEEWKTDRKVYWYPTETTPN